MLSAASLPEQLFVEGAGSASVNGKFVRRTGKDGGLLETSECNQSAWFVKEDDEGCWIGFLDHTNIGDQSRWIIFTSKEILYAAPTTDDKIPPREGRWELGGTGAAPAPTVNVQPLPAAFRLSGWEDQHDVLNGEYLPLDDSKNLLNGRPIFTHTPVTGVRAQLDRYRMHWSHGAWRIGDKDQLKPDQEQCMAFFESDSTHPTGALNFENTTAAHPWQATENGRDFNNVMGVSIETGTVRAL